MILTGKEITKQVSNNRIIITPFNSENVNPNSYNVELGDYLKVYEEDILEQRDDIIGHYRIS